MSWLQTIMLTLGTLFWPTSLICAQEPAGSSQVEPIQIKSNYSIHLDHGGVGDSAIIKFSPNGEMLASYKSRFSYGFMSASSAKSLLSVTNASP